MTLSFACRACLAAALACLTTSAGAQQKQQPPPAGSPKDFAMPAAKRFTLPNGLRVTLVPFGQVPKATIRVVVDAANRHEAKDEVWLADLTGSMMREGTASLTADAVAREFAGMGGDLGIIVGGDTTSVTTEVLSDRAADGVRLIAEVVQRPRLPATELERVRGNLLRELAIQRSTPDAIASERFAQLVYGDHPYGRLFPTEEALKGYTIEQIRAFHRAGYAASRSRLYVAGVFDGQVLERAVRDAFGTWERGTPAAPLKPPAPGGERFALLDRADAPQSTVKLGLRVPTPSDKDWIALEVTNALLGGAFASRITANIREQKGYTYSPFAVVTAHPGVAHWVETADVTTKVTGESVKEIFFEIERLRKEAPAADELRGIQNYLAGLFVVQNASRAGVIGRLAFVDLHGLGDDYLSTYVKRVMAITPEDVRRVAHDHFQPDKMTLVVVGDVKAVKEQLTPWVGR